MAGTSGRSSFFSGLPKSQRSRTRWLTGWWTRHVAAERTLQVRWPYRAFFLTAAVVYGLLAVVHAADDKSDVWPGDDTWTVVYGLAAAAALLAAVFEEKAVAGPRRWWWAVGLAITPLVFGVRLVSSFVEQGIDAVEVGLLSLWMGVGLVWAALLIRAMPPTGHEWGDLADEVRTLKRDVKDIQDHIGGSQTP